MADIFKVSLAEAKAGLETFLSTHDDFKDYNFDGSGISQLVDVGAYIIQSIAFNLNMRSNETFIAYAQLESNILGLAHQLNYLPNRNVAPSLSVTMTSLVHATSAVHIPRGTVFSMGSISLTNLEDIDFAIGESTPKSVTLHEGTIDTEIFYHDGTDFKTFELTERDKVDNDEFHVYVDEWNGSTYDIYPEWKNIKKLDYDVGGKVFYLDHFDSLFVKFDNGRLFIMPDALDKIRVEYLKTEGSTYNGSTAAITVVAPYDTDVSITNPGTLSGGLDKESLDSIKTHAPQFYSTQNRAVAQNDYNYLVTRYSNYGTLKDAYLWGGETEFIEGVNELVEESGTRDVGHIYLSAVKSDYAYLSSGEQTSLETYINGLKFQAFFFRFMHPTFVFINPTINVKYESVVNPNSTLEADINTYLDSYDGYNKTFNTSNVNAFVDAQDNVKYMTSSFTTSCTAYNETHKVIRLNGQITPSSISGTIASKTYADDGAGVINYDGSPIGTINYTTGYITTDYDFGVTSYSFDFEYASLITLTVAKETMLRLNDITLNAL